MIFTPKHRSVLDVMVLAVTSRKVSSGYRVTLKIKTLPTNHSNMAVDHFVADLRFFLRGHGKSHNAFTPCLTTNANVLN